MHIGQRADPLPFAIVYRTEMFALLCYAGTQASDQTAIIWLDLFGTATHDDRAFKTMNLANWLRALRIYLSSSAIGHLIWEILQLPLYTIWTAQFRDQVFAVIHCTLGDILIALGTLVAALIAAGNLAWPQDRLWRVAAATILLGVGYTIFSEWLNVTVRASWAYSEWMPVVSVFGLHVGLSPLLQWVVIPATAFTITQKRMARAKFV